MSQVTDAPAGTSPALISPADLAAVRQAGDPRVSPDGATIAFTVTDPDLAANRYARRIWLAPAGGAGAGPAAGPPRPVTRPGPGYPPRWSPRGRAGPFPPTEAGSGQSQGCVLPVAGGGERLTVCALGVAPTELEWSPDGRAL